MHIATVVPYLPSKTIRTALSMSLKLPLYRRASKNGEVLADSLIRNRPEVSQERPRARTRLFPSLGCFRASRFRSSPRQPLFRYFERRAQEVGSRPHDRALKGTVRLGKQAHHVLLAGKQSRRRDVAGQLSEDEINPVGSLLRTPALEAFFLLHGDDLHVTLWSE